jgi:hypothetical protein
MTMGVARRTNRVVGLQMTVGSLRHNTADPHRWHGVACDNPEAPAGDNR